MRLLQHSGNGEFCFTKDLVDEDRIPPYAILSHTWGSDTEEITFEDVANGTGEHKAGYEKIRFCGEQARHDGLEYFWIDPCCINKTHYAELSQAIKSMFSWYRNATRCYVYLSDVSSPPFEISGEVHPRPWESDFRKSRWFSRGWTLQELLAPYSVEFFSRERRRLGDKLSLREQIYEISGIPDSALRGTSLSQFSVSDRLSWIECRQTKLEEDRAYSLLGIFDVYIPPIYGEGTGSAFKRLLDEIDKLEKCAQDLRLTDPRDDKKRIEETKGGLLRDSYRWILENSDFQQWQHDQQSRLLWIKSDPGKGKTMLLCGIVNELEKSRANTDLLSYFFCQATDSRINNATAVLRGLVFLLVNQQPSLISHLRVKHDKAGKTLFEDANAWYVLSEIFTNILQDSSLSRAYLVIDALDECVKDMPKLLDFNVQKSSISPRVKWIVSSRSWPDIEEVLERATYKVRLSLELTAESVSTAVSIYIRHKVLQLAQRKKYDEKTRDAVLDHLFSNANDTFLWVALVCQNLKKTLRWNTLAKLDTFPPGLDSLYERMIEQIYNSDYADLCKRVLASIAIVYRPITLKELTSLIEMLEDVAGDLQSLGEIISLCGSFLTIRKDTIYFVHQSVKDYLLREAFDVIFPSGKGGAHYTTFSRSLQIMSRTLRRDMYSLEAPAFHIDQVKPPELNPLAAVRYSCVYWADHLCAYSGHTGQVNDLEAGGAVDYFMRKKYLYWLEALSLFRSMSDGVVSMVKLEALIDERAGTSALIGLVRDARRFIMTHKLAIENSPLQVYTSALVFSPARSLTRGLFIEEEPKWVTIKPAIGDKWSACLQTLEGHSNTVRSVAFSHDSAYLASVSDDRTVKIWDISSDECLQMLDGHSNRVNTVAFSYNSTWLASASRDSTVKIWDTSSGECIQTLEGHSSGVRSVAFSHDSNWLVSASNDSTARIWDIRSGECLQTLKGHNGWVNSIAFSHDSTWLASGSYDSTVKIWDTSSGECLQTLDGHSSRNNSVAFAFSHDSTCLASASDDNTIKIWDTKSGECLQTLDRTLEGPSHWVRSLAFSYDSTQLALASVASLNSTVKILDTSSGECLQTLCIGKTLSNISFDHTGSYLHTEIGTIAISAVSALNMAHTVADPQNPRYQGWALSSDGVWITYNSTNLVWLPSEYRPSCSIVLGTKIGIGVGLERYGYASSGLMTLEEDYVAMAE